MNALVSLLPLGSQLNLCSVRQQYPLTLGMSVAKDLILRHKKCAQANSKPFSSVMGNLPASPVIASCLFTHTGVDYGSPFILKDMNQRVYKKYKAYICIFVCFSLRAIHLELIGLSSNMFLTALQKFISFRGKLYIYSNNGTNFVGAKRKLSNCTHS